jgi:hypothetical protein
LGYKTPYEIASKYGLDIAKCTSWKTTPLGNETPRGKILLPRYGTGINKLLKTLRSRK